MRAMANRGRFQKDGHSTTSGQDCGESGKWRRGVAKSWCGQWPIEGIFRKTGIAALHVSKIIFGESGKVEARSRGNVVRAMEHLHSGKNII